jgi:hypothetical protein
MPWEVGSGRGLNKSHQSLVLANGAKCAEDIEGDKVVNAIEQMTGAGIAREQNPGFTVKQKYAARGVIGDIEHIQDTVAQINGAAILQVMDGGTGVYSGIPSIPSRIRFSSA